MHVHEICYVVMVGLEGDEELQLMPSMGDFKYFSLFQHKGLINSKAGYTTKRTGCKDNKFNRELL